MFFLLVGIVGLAMKYFEYGPVATLSWWWVLSPFLAAMAWWAWADASGYTKRREMEKMDERTLKRINKQRLAMGLAAKKKPGSRR